MWINNYYGYYIPKLGQIHRVYECMNEDCFTFKRFSRYKVSVDGYQNMIREEYALGDFYVKVYPEASTIFKMVSFILTDEIIIPRALWLNKEDMNITLTTIKTIVLFS
jgi:hypothetical protein